MKQSTTPAKNMTVRVKHNTGQSMAGHCWANGQCVAPCPMRSCPHYAKDNLCQHHSEIYDGPYILIRWPILGRTESGTLYESHATRRLHLGCVGFIQDKGLRPRLLSAASRVRRTTRKAAQNAQERKAARKAAKTKSTGRTGEEVLG